MADDVRSEHRIDPELNGNGLHVAVVASRFNDHVTLRLLDGARRGQCAAGIQQAQLDTGVPIAFGVLTTENLDQALARSQDAGGHNVGEEGARVVVEMARLVETVSPGVNSTPPGFAR